MKTRYLKTYNKLISYLLALLGVSLACSNGCAMYGTPAEYGTPNATFKVLGKVTTEQDVAIPNIQVVLDYDTAFTDNLGNYQVQTVNFPDNQIFPVHFKDVDEVQNGEFQPLDTVVEFKDPQFTGGTGNWNAGETEKEFNIKLKPLK